MLRLTLVLACACPLLALADPAQHQSRIDSSASNYRGIVSINQAAGDYQQQSNARALAIGLAGSAATQQRQTLQVDDIQPALNATASIDGAAFTAGSGVLGVNQSAGAATQQANSVRISIQTAPLSLDDSVLAQSVAITANSGPVVATPGERRVVTDDKAFVGSRGVVQLNQSAGVGSRMANTLSIRVAD
ncbi:adhesin [Pseudomonas sp. LS44]|uniref:adhesin n=1 Tax=Pseudomonas sp. LS44 TaxID=1357074 RepID=UPI00215AAD3A|nr:adhesin [Pseudomonas sp. LS44]UVE19521.1 adhesin [Pseudomonas sp. LS44]